MFEFYLIRRASALNGKQLLKLKLICRFVGWLVCCWFVDLLVCSFVALGPETCVKSFNHFILLSALARQIEKNYCDGKLVCNFKRQICSETRVQNLQIFFNSAR